MYFYVEELNFLYGGIPCNVLEVALGQGMPSFRRRKRTKLWGPINDY